jgi:hypothetical protein
MGKEVCQFMVSKSQNNDAEKRAWVLRAIPALRKGEDANGNPYMGIHVVYSNFNAAFKARFGEDSRATTDAMIEDGSLEVSFVRGGAIIYLAGEKPQPVKRVTAAERKIAETLALIG